MSEQYYGGGTGSRGKESNPRVAAEYNGYKNGDIVSVFRSDGTLENDWTFIHQRMDTGEILVKKKIDGKIKQKEIPSLTFDQSNFKKTK